MKHVVVTELSFDCNRLFFGDRDMFHLFKLFVIFEYQSTDIKMLMDQS
jgi:hypothetical protein